MARDPNPLILASASPQRRKLLARLGRKFKVVASGAHERSRQKNPRLLVLSLARRKSKAVAKKYPQALVLGADTIVVCRGKIIGKPKNQDDAQSILRLLNGRWHRVYTGLAATADGGKTIASAYVMTKVKARRLAPQRLLELSEKHQDKAGGYALQDREDPFIERIEGSRDNVIGLPLKAVRLILAESIRLSLAERTAG